MADRCNSITRLPDYPITKCTPSPNALTSATAIGCSTTTASASTRTATTPSAEIEVRTGTLDNRNMVCDFSDIKRVVKGWIDRELDHKMLLRHDDPLVAPLQQLGEPSSSARQQSDRRAHREADLRQGAPSTGFPVVRVTVWETPTSFAEFRASPEANSKPTASLELSVDLERSHSSSSISTAR